MFIICFFNDSANTEIYTYLHTVSLHDARPMWCVLMSGQAGLDVVFWRCAIGAVTLLFICGLMGFLNPGLLSWGKFFWAVISGAFIVGNWVLLFAAYSRASIGIATAVYSTNPLCWWAWAPCSWASVSRSTRRCG